MVAAETWWFISDIFDTKNASKYDNLDTGWPRIS